MRVQMKTDLIEFEGISIELQRKSIKNIHFRVYPPDGRVKISAPLRFSLKTIYQQIATRSDWIHTQRKRIQAIPYAREPMMCSGETHVFLGQPCILQVSNVAPYKKVFMQDAVIHLSANPQASTTEKYNLLQAWYRQQMTALLPELIKKWQKIVGVDIAAWGIKKMKTRWGSCNIRTRRIWLNLTLIEKPLLCLESVLVHELVHLHEASHNARFYALMDQFMPEWRQAKQLLNDKSPRLFIP